MALDWGAGLQAAGQGMGIYAQYLLAMQAAKQQQEENAADRALRRTQLDLQRQGLEQDASLQRDRLNADLYGANLRSAEGELSRLAQAGVHPGPGFRDSYLQSLVKPLPSAIGDTGALVTQQLHRQGSEAIEPFYTEAPDALNRLMADPKLETMSAPLGDTGGFVSMQPSVLASLKYAQTNADIAAANRAHERNLQREKFEHETGGGAASGDPALERKRIEYVTQTAAELMKPQMDPLGFRVVGPGMSQAEAYREAQKRWEMAVTAGRMPTPTPPGVGPGTVPKFNLMGRAMQAAGPTAAAVPITSENEADAYDELRARGLSHEDAMQAIAAKFGTVQ